MPFPSMRPLIAGSGTVSTNVGIRILTFSTAQSFKSGTSIVVDSAGATPQWFTIEGGAGVTWHTRQVAYYTLAAKPFLKSNDSTVMPAARARGGPNTHIIPDATHYIYRATTDHTGAPDVTYTYGDTLTPENGRHPYTLDTLSNAGQAARYAFAIIPDQGTRLRMIEGVLRGAPGAGPYGYSLMDPGIRFELLEARVNKLEQRALSTSVPIVVTSSTPYTRETYLALGDNI